MIKLTRETKNEATERSDATMGTKITIEIDKSEKILKGNSEWVIDDGTWKIMFKPQETTKLYLFSKELIIGKDDIYKFEQFLELHWDVDEICIELEDIFNMYNSNFELGS